MAYRLGEVAGVPVWCQDEAGPYQAIPQPGASWQPRGEPARQPHEYIRGGTAKLLTLFHPATGAVRAKGVTQATNAVLHPWLQAELTQILANLPALTLAAADRPQAAQWATWLGHEPHVPLPPLRLLLVWDNLAGHLSGAIVDWLFQHGIMPLNTPISGSWLNMAESVQRILVPRASRPAPAERCGRAAVLGGHRRRLERRADTVRLGRQAPGAPPAGETPPPWRFRRCPSSFPVICGVTH